jgi:hypothetical protein
MLRPIRQSCAFAMRSCSTEFGSIILISRRADSVIILIIIIKVALSNKCRLHPGSNGNRQPEPTRRCLRARMVDLAVFDRFHKIRRKRARKPFQWDPGPPPPPSPHGGPWHSAQPAQPACGEPWGIFFKPKLGYIQIRYTQLGTPCRATEPNYWHPGMSVRTHGRST